MGGTLTVLKEELKKEELGHTVLRMCLSGCLQTITEVHKTLPWAFYPGTAQRDDEAHSEAPS